MHKLSKAKTSLHAKAGCEIFVHVSSAMPKDEPLLSVSVTRTSGACPFTNASFEFSLRPGEVVWLRGASGAGKSFTCLHLAGLATMPGATIETQWSASVPETERIGFLFQKGVLVDSLNLAENVALALRASNRPYPAEAIGRILSEVGLSAEHDGGKMPGQLSGGMLRRAALAQILAQGKRVVVLDEPFVGLDPPVAEEVVKLVRSVAGRASCGFVLVSHMEPLASKLKPTQVVQLERFAASEDDGAATRATNLGRLPMLARARARLVDYFLYSLPLIVCAFGATGAAVSMLLADMLERVDVVKLVSDVLSQYMAGNPMLPMILTLVDQIVRQNEKAAKKKLYALAISYIFSVELGPLLTALLLAGRIGGSYAGEVSMMAATHQLELLSVLGVPRLGWTFVPAMAAALLAAPLLTAIGTAVALWVGGVVAGPVYGFDLMESDEYWREVNAVVVERGDTHLLKYPPLVNFYRSLGFMASTMVIAQLCAGLKRRLQPRNVPLVITTAVVTSCLLVIFIDWFFSQMYVRIDAAPYNIGAAAATAAADGDNTPDGGEGAAATEAAGGGVADLMAAMGGSGLSAEEEQELDAYYDDDGGGDHGDEL